MGTQVLEKGVEGGDKVLGCKSAGGKSGRCGREKETLSCFALNN